jgi:hypothetical protein
MKMCSFSAAEIIISTISTNVVKPIKKMLKSIQYELLISIPAFSELQGGNGKSRMVNLSIKKC